MKSGRAVKSARPESPGGPMHRLNRDLRNIELISDDLVLLWRSKTPAEKLEIVFGMWETARLLIAAHVKSIHPDWDDDKIAREVARRLSHGKI